MLKYINAIKFNIKKHLLEGENLPIILKAIVYILCTFTFFNLIKYIF